MVNVIIYVMCHTCISPEIGDVLLDYIDNSGALRRKTLS